MSSSPWKRTSGVIQHAPMSSCSVTSTARRFSLHINGKTTATQTRPLIVQSGVWNEFHKRSPTGQHKSDYVSELFMTFLHTVAVSPQWVDFKDRMADALAMLYIHRKTGRLENVFLHPLHWIPEDWLPLSLGPSPCDSTSGERKPWGRGNQTHSTTVLCAFFNRQLPSWRERALVFVCAAAKQDRQMYAPFPTALCCGILNRHSEGAMTGGNERNCRFPHNSKLPIVNFHLP